MALKLEKEMTVEEMKIFLGSLKKDQKNIIKGAPRRVFLNEILTPESTFENMRLAFIDFNEKKEKETERAYEFLMNEEEAELAGWNYTGNKKNIVLENNKKQLEWCEKAYPKYQIDLWENQFDIENLVKILKGE